MIPKPSPANVPLGAVRQGQRWQAAGICCALAAITFVVFGQTLTHDFVGYDDQDYVSENSLVQGGLSVNGLVWAFTHADCHLYHPLTILSLMADHQLYGMRAGGYHFTNLLLHTASVLLLFLVLRQMTGAFWRSAFVAAIFAIHPLRVESVAWVAERKDVLSGLFFMLTLAAYLRYVRQPPAPSRYLLVAGAFLPALLCKPTVVTLPFVLLLLDYWPLRRFAPPAKRSRLILEKIPLLALALGSCAGTFLAAHKLIVPLVSVSLGGRIGNGLVSYAVYLRQMVWPEGLAVPYPYPLHGLLPWEVVLSGALLAAFSAGAWWQRRQRPWLWVGWVWYVVMLLPMAGFFQIGDQAHADRHTYLPQIGIYAGLTWLAAEWGAKWRIGRVTLGTLAAAVIAALMVCAWKQTSYWKNSETLWTRALACTTNNYLANFNLGNALRKQGKVNEAVARYQKALEIDPRHAQAHVNLGAILSQKGRLNEAISQFQTAVQFEPDNAEAHYNLALALGDQGHLGEAIPQYMEALRIQPDSAQYHYNLGNALARQGRLDEAVLHYQQALQLDPGDAKAQNNLASTLLRQGRVAEAIAHFQQALQLRPEDPSTLSNVAWLLAAAPAAAVRDGKKAVELATRANQLTGGTNQLILHTLAAAYAEAGRFPEALATAQHALGLAQGQSNAGLAGQLQSEIKLYQAGSPYHLPRP
jgi:Flp pilus assembly protein TadD